MFSLQIRQLHLLHPLHLQALHAVIPANITHTLTLRMWQGRYRAPLSTLTHENAEREKARKGTGPVMMGRNPHLLMEVSTSVEEMDENISILKSVWPMKDHATCRIWRLRLSLSFLAQDKHIWNCLFLGQTPLKIFECPLCTNDKTLEFSFHV